MKSPSPLSIRQALASGAIEQALALLSQAEEANPEDAELAYLRGAALAKRGDLGAALTHYRRSARLDPAGPAQGAVELLTGIMDFYHKDLYNP